MRGRTHFLAALALITIVVGVALRTDSRAEHSAAAWADAYTYNPSGSTMYFFLDITGDSNYTLRLSGCFSTSEISRGSVAYRDGLLHFNPTRVEQGYPPELGPMAPIRWEDSLYLVEANRVDEFMESLRSSELGCIGDCTGFFYIRDLDIEKLAEARRLRRPNQRPSVLL